MTAETRNWRKRWRTMVGGLIAFVLLGGIAAQMWGIPAVIRAAVVRELPTYWDGRAEIGEIEFSFFQPVVLRDITLVDAQGRQWFSAASVELKLDDWPGVRPVLTRIEVERPELRLYVVNGTCQPPIRTDRKKDDSPNPYVDLQMLNVRDFSLTTMNDGGGERTWEGAAFSALRKGPVFELRLSRVGTDGTNNLLLGGTVNPETLETQLSLTMGGMVESESMAVLLGFWDKSFIRQAAGKVMANLTVSGKLDEPEMLCCRGMMNLNDWQLDLFEDLTISNLDSVVWIEGRRIDVEHLTAESCDGCVAGDLLVRFPHGQPVAYGGDLSAENIDMDKLTRGISVLSRMEQGRGNARYNFTMEGGEIDRLHGVGLLTLDNAHLWNLPVILQLFNQFKIHNSDPMGISDVAALFVMKGPQMTFQRAMLANAISAIEMDRGGRVNLASHQVDLYVVGVPLKALRKFLSAIPLVKLVVPLRDRLTRLHLKGSWNDSSTALIFREPLRRLEETTRDFLKMTAEADGQFDAETLKAFRETFDGLLLKQSSF